MVCINDVSNQGDYILLLNINVDLHYYLRPPPPFPLELSQSLYFFYVLWYNLYVLSEGLKKKQENCRMSIWWFFSIYWYLWFNTRKKVMYSLGISYVYVVEWMKDWVDLFLCEKWNWQEYIICVITLLAS